MSEDKTSTTESTASTNKYVDTVKPVYGEYPIKRVLNEENVAEKKKLDKKRKEAEKKAKEKAKNASSKSTTSTDEESSTDSSSTNSTKSASTSSSTSTSSSSSSSSTSSTDSTSSSSTKSTSKTTRSFGTNTIGAIAAGKKGTESEKLDEILKTIKEDDTTWTDEDGKKKKKTLVQEDLSTSKAQKNPFLEKILRPLQSSMKEGMLEVYETDEENFTPYESTPEENEKDKDKDDTDEDEEEDTDEEESDDEDSSDDEEEITYHQGEILSTSYYPFNFSYTFDTDYTEGTGESKVESYIFTDEDLNYIYKGVRVLLKLGWLQFGEKLPTSDAELKIIKADITSSVTARITKLFKQKWASQQKAYKEYEKTKAEQEAAQAEAQASSSTSTTDEDSSSTTSTDSTTEG